MDAVFWHERWEKNELGFHQPQGNPLLIKHYKRLPIKQDARLFLPLCGKTRDIGWLRDKGFHILGCELSELAVQQLFEELEILPNVRDLGVCKQYSAKGLDIFVGDVFKLTPEMLGQVDAVYDRAALVALPIEMREAYSNHLRQITKVAPQLLIVYEYDQNSMAGPPFSISDAEVVRHYGAVYEIEDLERVYGEDCLKGRVSAYENVKLLLPK